MADYCKANHHGNNNREDEVMDLVEMLKELNDDPVADPVMVSQYYIAKLAVENKIKVIQCGEGQMSYLQDIQIGMIRQNMKDLIILAPMTIKKQWYKKSFKIKENILNMSLRCFEGEQREKRFLGSGRSIFVRE